MCTVNKRLPLEKSLIFVETKSTLRFQNNVFCLEVAFVCIILNC